MCKEGWCVGSYAKGSFSRGTVFYIKQIWAASTHLCDETTGHSLTVDDDIFSSWSYIQLSSSNLSYVYQSNRDIPVNTLLFDTGQ